MTPQESMARCQYAHDLRQCPVAVGSPQTQPQRDQVTRIINRLMTQNRFLRRTISDVSLSENTSIPSPTRSPRSGANTPNSRKKATSLEGTEHDEIGTARNTQSIHLEIESNSEKQLDKENSKTYTQMTKSSQMEKPSPHLYTPSSSQPSIKLKHSGNMDTETPNEKMNVESSNHKNVQIPYEPAAKPTTHTNQSSSISSSFIGALRSFRVTTKGTT